MSLREQQVDATRTAIVDAFLELAHTENAVNISVPAVAESAGVSIRTVYRHFPAKDDLQTAAAYRMSEQVERTVSLDSVDLSTMPTYLSELWSGFATQLPAVIAEHTTPSGRELRRTRLPGSRQTVARALADDVDADLVDLIVAVTSSSMFLELVDRMGHSPERAAEIVSRLVHLIHDHLTEEST